MPTAIKQGNVVEIFEVLFGDNTRIKQVAEALDASTAFIAGRFVDNEGNPKAWMVCDLPFAAGAGAALTMIPPDTVKESIRAEKLSDNLDENLREVMNICGSIFQTVLETQVRFDNLIPSGDEVFAGGLTASTFEIQLPRYGSGKITLLSQTIPLNALWSSEGVQGNKSKFLANTFSATAIRQ
ncbi:MAG: hypothetical protein R3C03_01345 [Pirellulaceae bacterium]